MGRVRSFRPCRGFTLVELLVVIGIIAVLISVLLPALSSARKAAATVKCSAALREIGNAALMYAQDNKGFLPPAKLQFTGGATYKMNDYTFSNTNNQFAFWFDFLAKYVTKSKVGNAANASAATAGQDAAQARRSIFWGCPAWDGFYYTSSSNLSDISQVQTGYGWNAFPEYTASYPASGRSLHDDTQYPNKSSAPAIIDPSGKVTGGVWYKLIRYTHPAERALAGDSMFWLLQTDKPADAQGKLLGVRVLSNSAGVTNEIGGGGYTTCDWYRHGKYPSVVTASGLRWFDATGGKPSYNILYADGHVRTANDRADIWRAQRQRYPEP